MHRSAGDLVIEDLLAELEARALFDAAEKAISDFRAGRASFAETIGALGHLGNIGTGLVLIRWAPWHDETAS